MTEYRLAASGHEYSQAHKLMRKEGLEQEELSFPTILAWKGKELTGFMSTHISNNMIVAGPLVIKNGQPRYWTLIRLIEHYENVMRASGISSYIFSVDVERHEWLEKINQVFELKPYAEENGRKFFVRKL